jgi:hypothetical protein
MYEVFAVITDSLGTRMVPTGDGSVNRQIAENLLLRRMTAEPTTEFFLNYVPSPDEWNAY